MIEVSSCVICEKPIKRLKKALVAPFVADWAWNREPFCVDLMGCDSCGFMFYNPRLEDDDLQRLYRGYRSEEFQKRRFETEPWYTKSFNHDLGSEESYTFRRQLLAPILREHLKGRKIERILDYGGDKGELVIGLVDDAQAFSYDISGIEVVPGVTHTSDPASCKADLVINSNVLEHVGFPRELVSQIIQATPQGGLIFLEAPIETPFGFSRIIRRIAQIGIMSLLRPKTAPFILRPATLYMMHMHINYYTVHSLSMLATQCGARVVASDKYFYPARAGSGYMAWCLAEKA